MAEQPQGNIENKLSKRGVIVVPGPHKRREGSVLRGFFVGGTVGVLAALFTFPFGGDVALICGGVLGFVVAMIAAAPGSDNNDSETRTEIRDMNTNLPVLHHRTLGLNPYEVYTPPYFSTQVTPPDHRAVLAHVEPRIAARVFERTSLDQTATSIIAPAVAEFARQGRGSHFGIKRTRSFFGGNDGVEGFVEPIEPR